MFIFHTVNKSSVNIIASQVQRKIVQKVPTFFTV